VELNIWQLYLYSLKSSQTRKKYQGRLDKFFDFVGVEGETTEEKSIKFVEMARLQGIKWVFNVVLNFMLYQVNRVENKEIVASTVQNYKKSVKLLCDLADIEISWKRISRGLPRGKSFADDRIPTDLELEKIVEYPDRRIKAIIYTMISSGIRLGAWDYLKWENIRPIEKDGAGIVAARVTVYSGEEEEYHTYISKEAYLELLKWIKYRQESGEIIDGNSWVMRDLWDSDSLKNGKGFVTIPKKLASSGIKRLIERAIWAQGLRSKLEYGKKRYPFSAVHSLRKWFKTRCELGGMKPINIEILLCHSVGISSSYYRPTEKDLLDDYLKVVDYLSIDRENKLKQEMKLYKEKNNTENNSTKIKLQEKDELIKQLNIKYEQDLKNIKEEMNEQFGQIMKMIQQNPLLANVKQEVLEKFH
jgi:integrase